MPSNTRASTASGVPDHLQQPAISGVGAPPSPVQPMDQRLPQQFGRSGLQGVVLPIDPVLQLAGAYWNDARQLVRSVIVEVGATVEVDGRKRVPVKRKERLVAPPGMTLDQARDNGLDFFSPQYGWIRAGVKREQEYPENLGGVVMDVTYEEVPDDEPGGGD